MKKSRRPMQAILGSRKPVVAARLVEWMPDGSVRVEPLGDETPVRKVKNSAGKAERVARALERILDLGSRRLSDEEWALLFSRQPAQPDNRWILLVRLATEPKDKEGELRDQFAALPDGTAFSMRLLLPSKQGGRRTGKSAEATDAPRALSFNRLPDVARLLPLVEVLRRLGSEVTPKEFATDLDREVGRLGLSVRGITAKDVTDRLFTKIRDNGGGRWLPEPKSTRGRKRLSKPTTGKEHQDD
jgi:hypothetical protein